MAVPEETALVKALTRDVPNVHTALNNLMVRVAMKRPSTTKLVLLGCLLGMSALPKVRAGDVTYDFTTDPSTIPGIVINGGNDTPWLATGGNPGGFLALLYSIGSTAETIVFPDIDNGLTVAAFTFETDLRIGNAQGNSGRPADGFSVSFARANDPVLASLPDSAGPSSFAASGQPEDGTGTGIAIGFDTWQGNVLPDDPAGDCECIIVRVDNKTILKNPMATRNGACDDPTSMQTGPYNDAYWTTGLNDPHDPQAWAGLCWAHLKVELDQQGKLSVTWKNKLILDHFQTTYFPSIGRLVLAGRTGGANENTHFDNIHISTITSAAPLLTDLKGSANGFIAQLTDATGAPVDPASVTAQLNGKTVTVVSTKTGSTTSVVYSQTTFDPSGQTNAVALAYKDTNGKSYTANRSYIVPNYTTIPADDATAAGSVDKTKPGFLVRPYQTAAGQPNTIAWTEDQLAGLHGPNTATTTGVDANGFLAVTTVVNWDKVSAGSADGNFTDANGYPDAELPGFPGTGGDYANASEEVITYIEFPAAGYYTMGVNSDDGFKVSVAKSNRDTQGLILGQFNGGRGASDTIFNMVVTQAGIYPIRLIWENGGSGANCEWFSVLPDGTKVLINDSKNSSALKAYAAGPTGGPWVSSMKVSAVEVKTGLTDSSDGVIDKSTVKASLDGSPITATVAKTGSVTTVDYLPSAPLGSGSDHKLTLNYTAGSALTRDITFTVPAYANIPASFAVDASKVDKTKPGFRVRPYQVSGGQPNTVQWTEEMFAGLHGTNIADLTQTISGSKIDGQGYYSYNDVVNWDKVSAGSSDGNFTSNNGYPDIELPGQPAGDGSGTYANDGEEVLTFIEFPSAGLFTMGVNSDDGFAVSTPLVPTTNSTSILLGEFNAGRGAADTLFSFFVPTAGIYPMRLLWENGGSGANCEWFSVNADGTYTLINDSKVASSLKVYQVGPTNAPPANASFISFQLSADRKSLTLTFTGSLDSADVITGPWTAENKTSPATVPTTASRKFYRVK
jgi:hypothetical protein